MLVSRLVAMTWCNGYSDGLTVNHINGNPLDNIAGNLEWISLRENIQKGYLDGLYDSVLKPVELISESKIERFASMAAASRFLGRNSGYVCLCVKLGRKATDVTGKKYEIAF